MCSGCHFIWAACKNRTIAMVSKEHYLDDFNPYSSSSTTVLTSRAPDWAATCMDGQPCAHMKHVAAAEYISRAERYVEMMGDGSQVPSKETRHTRLGKAGSTTKRLSPIVA